MKSNDVYLSKFQIVYSYTNIRSKTKSISTFSNFENPKSAYQKLGPNKTESWCTEEKQTAAAILASLQKIASAAKCIAK